MLKSVVDSKYSDLLVLISHTLELDLLKIRGYLLLDLQSVETR